MMRGRISLVTGATDGIGRATAEQLALRGSDLFVCGRDSDKTARLVENLRRSHDVTVDSFVGDLSSLMQVRHLAALFTERHPRLDVLVNNVGSAFPHRRESEDGIEMTWALNHLGVFLLTNLLLDVLHAAPAGRVVTVSSALHRGGRIDFDDLQGRKSYHPWRAYRQSKLANVLFAFELARRLRGTGVTSNALHPGMVATAFPRPALIRVAKRALVGWLTLSPEEGARTSVYLACAPELAGKSGSYFAREREARASCSSQDPGLAARLWEESARSAGLS